MPTVQCPCGARTRPVQRLVDRAVHRSRRWNPAAVEPLSVATIAALFPDPGSRIIIPLVARVGEPAKRRLDIVPTPLVVQPTTDQLDKERAPASNACPSIKFGDKVVVQRYVYPHGLTLAHSGIVWLLRQWKFRASNFGSPGASSLASSRSLWLKSRAWPAITWITAPSRSTTPLMAMS